MRSREHIRVLVANDHFMVRLGLSASLNVEADIKVIAEAGNAEAALNAYRQHGSDVVIMDVRLPTHHNLSSGHVTANAKNRSQLRQNLRQFFFLQLHNIIREAIHPHLEGKAPFLDAQTGAKARCRYVMSVIAKPGRLCFGDSLLIHDPRGDLSRGSGGVDSHCDRNVSKPYVF